MSMNLNIPITQTITLPDSWQACKTPQELSYWIIAKFDNFTTQFTEINNAMSALQSMIETNANNIATNDAEIAEIKNTLTSINSDIATLQTDYNTLNTDLTTLHGLHHQLSNKVAGMEDAVLDLPGIKNDISTLQTNVANNTERIANLNGEMVSNITDISNRVSDNSSRLDGTRYNTSTPTFVIDIDKFSGSYIIINNSNNDYRLFLNVEDVSRISACSFIVYYNSEYNVPFSHYNSAVVGRDITTVMESYSIDGSAALAEVIAKTKVAIRFFLISNNPTKFSWTVL